MRIKIVSLAAAAALFVACSSAAPVEDVGDTSQELSSEAPRREMPRAGAPSTANSLLIDHGGRVLPAADAYSIWWGNPGAFPSDARAGVDSLLEGLSGSAFLGISTQYMRGASSSLAFKGDLSDASSPPTSSPRVSAVVNEACRVIGRSGLKPDPSALYFVFTSNFPHQNSFCAWHSYGSCGGVTIQVAYMPNVAGVAGCDPTQVVNLACNGYSEGTVALANVVSHELMEALTDADLNAWYDASGSEIGDKCAWQFSSCVSLASGSWQLQEEWTNASGGGCQQQ